MTTIITRSCAFYEDNSHNLNNIAVSGCVKVKEVKDDLNEPSVSFDLYFELLIVITELQAKSY